MHKTTIICAVDFSQASLLGLRMAVRYAEKTAAHLRVVHVLPGRMPGTSDPGRQPGDPTDAAVDEALRRYCGGADWASASVEQGDVAEEIVRVAEHMDADLIFLGTRAKTGWERVRDGDIPGEIASSAGCPVVVLELHEELVRSDGTWN